MDQKVPARLPAGGRVKWRQPAAIRFAAWSDFDDFYTDAKPPSALPCKTLHLFLP
ncbi:MAG: hypothetical protein U1G05_17285 [Kiritimatiellia bacterium]